jgi:membrane associated rhomboid family serine protease
MGFSDRLLENELIPLRDANPSGTWPVVTVALILANAVAFWHQLSLGPELDRFVLEYGLVPAKVTYLGRIPGLSLYEDAIRPAFTSLFLHAGWLHLIGNMWYLWLFGDNVEDRLGHLGFLGFYLATGVAAGMVQVYASADSVVPVIGASGAIAGVLGAYMLCFPRARILTLVPILVFVQFLELPAFVVLFFWFALQFLNGTLSLGAAAGVAWWAHIGGFVAGMVLVRVLPRCRRSRQRYYRTRFG